MTGTDATRRGDVKGLYRVALGIVLFAATVFIANELQFPAAALDRPYLDPVMQRADEFLGFDWLTLFGLTWKVPALGQAMEWTYTGLLALSIFAVVFTAGTDGVRCTLFLIANALTLLITVAISAVWPVAGPAVFLHAPTAGLPPFYIALEAARAGTASHQFIGMIQFPSYHAALAMLVALTVPRALIITPCVAVVLCTPTIGGHYLTDVIAGVMLALGMWGTATMVLTKFRS